MTVPTAKLFFEYFNQLKDGTESSQKQNIEKMNKLINKMNEKEFKYVYTHLLLDKILTMIEDEKLSLENAILLMKHICYTKSFVNDYFPEYLFFVQNERFEKIVFDEERRQGRKNKELQFGLRVCCLITFDFTSSISEDLATLCIPCLLKVSLEKKKTNKAKKDIEMALLAIRNVLFEECMQKFQLDKHLKLIIKNHQQCNNLTHYAYQLAWNCFLKRLRDKRKIEAEIANDLHFVEEMTRELGELLQCVDWREKDMKLYEMKEVSIILNWINSYESLFDWKLPEEEVTVGLVERFFELYREAKDNHRKIAIACVEILQKMIDKETVNIGVMMRLRIEDIIIGEIRQHILDDMHTVNCAKMNLTVSERLKVNFKKKNANTFLKMLYTKYIEKLEEEGYEDAIISLQGMLHQKKFRNLSKNPCDYFV